MWPFRHLDGCPLTSAKNEVHRYVWLWVIISRVKFHQVWVFGFNALIVWIISLLQFSFLNLCDVNIELPAAIRGLYGDHKNLHLAHGGANHHFNLGNFL